VETVLGGSRGTACKPSLKACWSILVKAKSYQG